MLRSKRRRTLKKLPSFLYSTKYRIATKSLRRTDVACEPRGLGSLSLKKKDWVEKGFTKFSSVSL